MFTRLEEELAANDARASPDVQTVGEAEQRVIFLWIVKVEDVLVVDEDLLDHDTCWMSPSVSCAATAISTTPGFARSPTTTARSTFA